MPGPAQLREVTSAVRLRHVNEKKGKRSAEAISGTTCIL